MCATKIHPDREPRCRALFPAPRSIHAFLSLHDIPACITLLLVARYSHRSEQPSWLRQAFRVTIFFHHAQHNPATPMTALTKRVGLLHFTEQKRLSGRHGEMALIDQLAQRL